MPIREPLAIRLWRKVDKNGPVPDFAPHLGPCWLWTAKARVRGYGVIGTGNGKQTRVTHRVAYELVIGPIPEGLQLDHLCRVRHCVNPKHLEPVTQAENLRRGEGGVLKTHCPHGHPLREGNLVKCRRGTRECLTCARERARRRRLVNA